MIDFVKISITGCNKELLLENERLDFKRKISMSTGELENKQVAQFNCMELYVMDSGYIQLTGSLHKAYNSIAGIQAPQQRNKTKGFNGNQFDYTQLNYVLKRLERLIGFDSKKSILRNIEFGVNLEVDYEIPKILCNLMRHNGKPFRNPLPYYYQAEHYEYKVKCYFKSNQYRMPENVLRYELQVKTMKKISSTGINTVSDLLDQSKLDHLKRVLIQSWDKVILYDYTINESEVLPRDKKWLNHYKNSNYWNLELSSNRLDPHRKRLKRITENHSQKIQDQLRTEIEETWTRLNV